MRQTALVKHRWWGHDRDSYMVAEVQDCKRDWSPFWVLPIATMLIHFLCVNNYGYFRDELYYLACAKRLAWGYVDHPPFSVALLRVVTSLFGDSLLAIRTPVILCSGLTVFLVVLTAARLGASRLGTWLAGLCVMLSGMYLVIFSFYTMNAIDIVLWALAAFLFTFIFDKPKTIHWVLLGLVFGIGFLNKASILGLFIGTTIALVGTSHRANFRTIGPWVCAALTAGLAFPNIWWQVDNHWPTREFIANALREKMLPIAPWEFLAQQAVVVNIFAVPVIIAGVAIGFKKESRRFLPYSLIFLTVLIILILNGKSRVNYLAPAYPFVLASGAISIEQWFRKNGWKKRYAYIALASASPLYLSLGLPWLSPSAMTWIISKSPIQPPVEEKGPKSTMQGWADMFGWQELARDVTKARDQLDAKERSKVAVVAKNYGEASALEHYGVQPVICGHNNFWLWGPGDWNGDVAIFVNTWPDEVKNQFNSFVQVGTVDAPNSVPEQNQSPIWIAKKLKIPVSQFWKMLRKYV